MSGKDAAGAGARAAMWRSRLSWLASVCVVAGVCFAASRFFSAQSATAQFSAPRPTGTTQPAQPGATTRPTSTLPFRGSNQAAPQAVQPASANSPANTSGARTAAPVAPAAGKTAPAINTAELKVVAVVNAEQITRQDLARESLRRYGREVLESIVNKHLILQACQQRNIVITEKDVEDEINRIASKFGLSVDRWLALLEQERNVQPAEYRREIIWPTLALRTLAAGEIQVTPEEMRKAFEAEYGPKVRVRMISVSQKAKADQVLAKARANPELFESLAKDHSEDPSAAVMGLIPPIRKHVGDPQLEEVAFSLKKGEVSPVVKVANQYIILRCEDRETEKLLAGKELESAKEHLRDRIRDQKLRAAAGDLFKRLQDQSKVVNVYNDPQLSKQYPGVAAIINGQSITIAQLGEECITRHGATVLDGEINRLILNQELRKRSRSVSQQDIDQEVARAADSYGFLKKDGSPDIEKWLDSIKGSAKEEKSELAGSRGKSDPAGDAQIIDLYLSDAVWPSVALKKLVGTGAKVTEEDVRKGFESNYGERVEALAIVLSNQRQAQQVWELARKNSTDYFFGELAAQYSVEPASRANNGKVPPIRRHGGQPVVEDAAFKLKAGEISPILSVGDKFIVLRCTGRTTPVVRELNDTVRKELLKDLEEKKMRLAMTQEFDRLKETAQVDNFLAGSSKLGKRPGSAAVSRGTLQK